MYTRRQKKNTHKVIGLVMLLWLLSPFFLGLYVVYQSHKISVLRDDIKGVQNELNTVKTKIMAPEPTPSPSPSIEPSPTPQPPKKQAVRVVVASTSSQVGTWEGKVSHYSRAGCLGCSATLTMANGQELNDDAYTIAFNHLPLNTKVRLTNLSNGKSVEAIVTDRGGFEKYGRIADLTLAVARALESKTDVSIIKIEKI